MHLLFYARGQLARLFAIAISLEGLAEAGDTVKYVFCSSIHSSHTCCLWFGTITITVLPVLAWMLVPEVHSLPLFMVI